MSIERRKFPRFAIHFPILLRQKAGGKVVEAPGTASADISREGLGITLAGPLPAKTGDTLEVVITIDDSADDPIRITTPCEVSWIRAGACGIRFTGMSPDDHALYLSLLNAFGKGDENAR